MVVHIPVVFAVTAGEWLINQWRKAEERDAARAETQATKLQRENADLEEKKRQNFDGAA